MTNEKGTDKKDTTDATGLYGIIIVLVASIVVLMGGAYLTFDSLALSWYGRVDDLKEQLEKCEARKAAPNDQLRKEAGQCYKDLGDALSESGLCDQGFLQMAQLLKDCEDTLAVKGCVLDKMTAPESGP